MRRMSLPNNDKYNPDPAYVTELIARIGRPQVWIAERVGISRRRLQYLVAGVRMHEGQEIHVKMSYPEQFALEVLAEAGDAFQ
jgi:hypothetical protein